jgi:hypothetical protein
MDKSIHSLIEDIYSTVSGKEKGWFNEQLSNAFAQSVATRLREQLDGAEYKPTLRLSRMGPQCPRALWHSIHTPERAEALPPWAIIKYSYGHILEALVLTLAKAAGHDVRGEQDAVTVDGIKGHRDAVIDGCIVDVKSSSSFSFAKFKDGSIKQDDMFGYLDQLDGYLMGSMADPLVTEKNKGYLLAIDKQLGRMCLYEHELNAKRIQSRIKEAKATVESPYPPACTCGTVRVGKSGNIGLDVKASYNLFKHCCFPGLRTFIYSSGPAYLTRVVRKPDVPEVDKHGKLVTS